MKKRLGTIIAALCLVAASEVAFGAIPLPQPKPYPTPCPTWKRCPPTPMPCGQTPAYPCRQTPDAKVSR
jgi:hypothetical protein